MDEFEGSGGSSSVIDEPKASDVEADESDGFRMQATDEVAPLYSEGEQIALGINQPAYHVQCFGSFEVANADGTPVVWPLQKARELLAYLIAQEGRSVPREEVEEALWPDALPGQVERLLANAAYLLRKAFRESGSRGAQILSVSGQRYHLQRGLFRLDIDAFVAHLRRAEGLDGGEAIAEYERAFALYRGDFLTKEAYGWAASFRGDYQSKFVAAGHRAARLALDCREVEKAAGFYKSILARDGFNEEAVRGLMRCYDRLGDLTGVRKVYRTFCESLRRELDDDKAEPMLETKGLYAELSRTPPAG